MYGTIAMDFMHCTRATMDIILKSVFTWRSFLLILSINKSRAPKSIRFRPKENEAKYSRPHTSVFGLFSLAYSDEFSYDKSMLFDTFSPIIRTKTSQTLMKTFFFSLFSPCLILKSLRFYLSTLEMEHFSNDSTFETIFIVFSRFSVDVRRKRITIKVCFSIRKHVSAIRTS